MAELIVETVKVDSVIAHPNADRLSIATVKGWDCVIGKDQFKAGDIAVYIPIDSILPEVLEEKIFCGTKIKLSKHRIKTIRLRGAVSQGLLISLKQADLSKHLKDGVNVKEKLGITKYEPSVQPKSMRTVQGKSNRNPNTNFHKYTNLQNVKNYNKVFNENDEVSVTEKIHGTNFRAGWVKKEKYSFWEKVKKFFGAKVDEAEFVYGSHNIQLQTGGSWKGFYKTNVYAEAVHNHNLEESLKNKDVVIYGEIYGSGIQKRYNYGCLPDERKLVVFDVFLKGDWLNRDELVDFCTAQNLPCSLEIYRGKYDLEKIKKICTGNSKMHPEQKIIEGGVIKPVIEGDSYIGRKALKLINDQYLLQKGDMSEFH